jgi:peptide/nickel transport system substrate-binding protein
MYRLAISLLFGILISTTLACAPTPTMTPETPTPETAKATATRLPTPLPTRTLVPTATALPIKKNRVIIGADAMTAKHFNPLWLSSAPQFLAFPLILPALTWFDDQAQPILDLATRVDAAPDALTYTFTLPKNATWSDGTPLTAKDVAFTYKLALTPALNATLWTTNLASIKGALEYQRGAAKEIEGIKILDDHTIRFELREANGTFLFNTYLGILPAHILSKVDPREIERQPYLDAPLVTSGPYEFVKYELGKFIQLKKKPNYWGKSVNVEEITIQMYDTPAALVAALEAGDVHIAALTLEASMRARRLAQFDVLTARGTNAYVLYVDARTKEHIAALNKPKDQGGRGYAIARAPKPYLTDKRFRQALSYALDRSAMVQSVVNGEGAPVVTPLFAPNWALPPNLNPYDVDLERARAQLREAGLTFDAQGNALFENRPVTLVYLANTSEPARQLGQAIQNQLSQVGIRIESKLVPQENFLRAAINGEGDLILAVGARLGVDPSISALYYTCKAGWAELVMGYCNVKFDEWMSKGNAFSRNEDRQRFYWDASALLNDELPGIPLFAPNVFIGVSKEVKGVKPSTDPNFLTWNIAEWSVQK